MWEFSTYLAYFEDKRRRAEEEELIAKAKRSISSPRLKRHIH